jgi:hypothetical protein
VSIPARIENKDDEVVDEFNGYRTRKYRARERLDYTAGIEDRDNAP